MKINYYSCITFSENTKKKIEKEFEKISKYLKQSEPIKITVSNDKYLTVRVDVITNKHENISIRKYADEKHILKTIKYIIGLIKDEIHKNKKVKKDKTVSDIKRIIDGFARR